MARAGGGPRGVLARTPLRVSLVGILVVLVAVALAAAGLATTAALRGYLVGEVDEQLLQVTEGIVERGAAPPDGGRRSDDPYRLPSAYVVSVVAADGTVAQVLSAPVRPGEQAPDLPGLPVAEATARAGEPYTVSADGGQWRAVAVPFADGSGSLLVATDLDGVAATVRRLALLELAIGAALLAVLGGAGFLVVRRSLQPLREVERTAAAIAAGDLTRRVPDLDPRTEVGSVSAALNTMLGQVEQSFDATSRSEAEARASEVRMRRFVADASHELRTPLAAIRGWAELTGQGQLPPADVTVAVRRIEAEATRMGLLVEDLLLLARLDQQRPLERAPVDLLVVVGDAAADARAVAPDRRVAVEVLPGSGAPVVLGDEARLRQVVGNLVANACQHTPEGTPVTVRVGTAYDGWAVVEVADTGPGLAPEEVARVFERFYRAEGSRSRAHGGAGLGLSIVAALVAAHGGRVEVESEPGAGATFRVLLPVVG